MSKKRSRKEGCDIKELFGGKQWSHQGRIKTNINTPKISHET